MFFLSGQIVKQKVCSNNGETGFGWTRSVLGTKKWGFYRTTHFRLHHNPKKRNWKTSTRQIDKKKKKKKKKKNVKNATPSTDTDQLCRDNKKYIYQFQKKKNYKKGSAENYIYNITARLILYVYLKTNYGFLDFFLNKNNYTTIFTLNIRTERPWDLSYNVDPDQTPKRKYGISWLSDLSVSARRY